MSMEEPTPRSGRGRLLAALGAVVAAVAATGAAAAVRLKRSDGTHVRTDIWIDAAPADVLAFAADPRNDLEWVGGALERRLLEGDTIAPGTTFEAVDSIARRRVETIGRFVEHDARRSRVTVSGGWEGEYTIEVSAEGEGTRLEVELTMRANEAAMRIVDLMPSRVTRRIVDGDLARLKSLLEADGRAGAGAAEAGPVAIPIETEATIEPEAEPEKVASE